MLGREDVKLLPLAAVGVAKGVYEVFIKDISPSAKAWLAICAGVALYDFTCPQGETLSEGVDRALERHKLATLGAVAVTSAHLINLVPGNLQKYDPYQIAHRVVKGRTP